MNRSKHFGATLVMAILAALFVANVVGSGANSSSSTASSSSSSGTSSTNHHRSSGTATQARQSPLSAAASMIGALGSLVPGLMTNVAPLVLLFGIGALMMPSLGLSAMGLLRESRRSANDQIPNMVPLPVGPFAQYAARPLQSSPQDVYYFTKRSLPSLMSSFNSAPLLAGLQEVLERVVRAIDNADKRYN